MKVGEKEPMYLVSETSLHGIEVAHYNRDDYVIRNVIADIRSHPSGAGDAGQVLDKMFPANTKITSNGNLYGGWELDPKPLSKLKKQIQSNPQYEEEPEMETIEVVILAIKAELRRQQEQP